MTAFYCFVLFLSLGFWQESNTAPFKIAISTDKTTVVSGADVVVDVNLTNSSNRDVEEGVMYKQGINLDSTFRFVVRDERGKLVPKELTRTKSCGRVTSTFAPSVLDKLSLSLSQ